MQFLSLFYMLFILFLSCCSGCGQNQVEEKAEAVEVEVLRLISRNVAEKFELGGILEADESAMVTAEISGTIETQYFRDGDNVSEGDVLLRFDKEPFHLEI
jgi:membrane fusion protein (multidrug efflux system)